MKKTCALMLMILMYIPLALSIPVYATSHTQNEDVSKALETDDDKKKKEGQKEEEEPDCD